MGMGSPLIKPRGTVGPVYTCQFLLSVRGSRAVTMIGVKADVLSSAFTR